MRRLSDRPNWLLGIGLSLLGLMMLGAFWIGVAQERAQDRVAHALGVEKQLATVYSQLQAAETGQRGYLITGDPAYLEAYDLGVAKLPGELAGLQAATADNRTQQQAIARLRPLVDQRLARLRVGIGLRSVGNLVAAAEAVKTGQGRSVMEAIRRELDAMEAEEARVLRERQAQAETTTVALRLALLVGFAFLLFVTYIGVRQARRRLAAQIAAREELARINDRMVVEADNRERAEAQVRQMQKMEAIGQLTGGVAHDFNNMLSIVIGSLDLAKRKLERDPAKATHLIDNALEGAQRAAGLTARLLAFSRQQPLAPTVIDANKLVGGMSELLRRTLGELEVETVLAGGLWRIHADAPQLENAILNLAINARDAMPDGGALTIETSNSHLDDAYCAEHDGVLPGQYVTIAISDTGVGMSPEVAHRAFEPFYTTKGVGKGTGLGLSQVYGFVKQSGGHVKIYSEPGHGTSVKLYLPRWLGANEAEPVVDATSLPHAGGAEIVLLVEDDPHVRHMSVDALRELGYTVVTAADGASALQQLHMLPQVDLLFTDIVMPGMNGRRLADQALKERPGLKVLYTTGYTKNAVVHNGVLDAGVAFLPKPFTFAQLAAKVRQVLDGGGVNRPAASVGETAAEEL
jgi:signal transduction histidine kinase/CheY-like chemotaxis protein